MVRCLFLFCLLFCVRDVSSINHSRVLANSVLLLRGRNYNNVLTHSQYQEINHVFTSHIVAAAAVQPMENRPDIKTISILSAKCV